MTYSSPLSGFVKINGLRTWACQAKPWPTVLSHSWPSVPYLGSFWQRISMEAPPDSWCITSSARNPRKQSITHSPTTVVIYISKSQYLVPHFANIVGGCVTVYGLLLRIFWFRCEGTHSEEPHEETAAARMFGMRGHWSALVCDV